MTQTELAKRSGIPLATINSWIRGKRGMEGRGPEPDALRAVASALNLPVETVFRAAGRWLPQEEDLTREQIILSMWRTLGPRDRALIEAILRAMVTESPQENAG